MKKSSYRVEWRDQRSGDEYCRANLDFFEAKSLEYQCKKHGFRDVVFCEEPNVFFPPDK